MAGQKTSKRGIGHITVIEEMGVGQDIGRKLYTAHTSSMWQTTGDIFDPMAIVHTRVYDFTQVSWLEARKAS